MAGAHLAPNGPSARDSTTTHEDPVGSAAALLDGPLATMQSLISPQHGSSQWGSYVSSMSVQWEPARNHLAAIVRGVREIKDGHRTGFNPALLDHIPKLRDELHCAAEILESVYKSCSTDPSRTARAQALFREQELSALNRALLLCERLDEIPLRLV